jgi:protein phosphatase
LYVVADGVGGAQAGEVASGIVCATIENRVRAGGCLAEALEQAHAEVLAAASTAESLTGAASTAVAVHLAGASLQLAWVGDSRAYLWDGELKLLSKDHSLVQQLVDTAQLDFADMEQHPRKNVITQALGSRNGAPTAASKQGHLRTPCVLMLCSDGVSGELTEQELMDTLSSNRSAEVCARTLVEAAVNGGGQDNASCIIIRLPELEAPPANEPTLAFMRYGNDGLWHLANNTAAEDTRVNPQATAAGTEPEAAPPCVHSPWRKRVLALISAGLLLAGVYCVHRLVGWRALLDLI